MQTLAVIRALRTRARTHDCVAPSEYPFIQAALHRCYGRTPEASFVHALYWRTRLGADVRSVTRQEAVALYDLDNRLERRQWFDDNKMEILITIVCIAGTVALWYS